MTTTARILETWDMRLPDPVPGQPYFLDWVLRSPRQAGVHLVAGYNALLAAQQEIGGITSALEFFAGIGAQALMVDAVFDPPYHTLYEISDDAVEHLRTAFPDSRVERRDAYHPETGQHDPAELVVLDFGDLTAWKTRPAEPHRLLMNRVFARRPRAVVLTDVAARYLHLHKERYESLLGPGTCETYETYLDALAGRLRSLYGYRLAAGFWDRWSTVMTFVPADDDTPNAAFVATPRSIEGLVISR